MNLLTYILQVKLPVRCFRIGYIRYVILVLKYFIVDLFSCFVTEIIYRLYCYTYIIVRKVLRVKNNNSSKCFELDNYCGIPVIGFWSCFSKIELNNNSEYLDLLIKRNWISNYLSKIAKINNKYSKLLNKENSNISIWLNVIKLYYLKRYIIHNFNGVLCIIKPIDFIDAYLQNKYNEKVSLKYINLENFIKALNSQKTIIELILNTYTKHHD